MHSVQKHSHFKNKRTILLVVWGVNVSRAGSSFYRYNRQLATNQSLPNKPYFNQPSLIYIFCCTAQITLEMQLVKISSSGQVLGLLPNIFKTFEKGLQIIRPHDLEPALRKIPLYHFWDCACLNSIHARSQQTLCNCTDFLNTANDRAVIPEQSNRMDWASHQQTTNPGKLIGFYFWNSTRTDSRPVLVRSKKKKKIALDIWDSKISVKQWIRTATS